MVKLYLVPNDEDTIDAFEFCKEFNPFICPSCHYPTYVERNKKFQCQNPNCAREEEANYSYVKENGERNSWDEISKSIDDFKNEIRKTLFRYK